MPDVSAVLQGGGDSGGLTAVPSVDDSPDGGVSAVRGENCLLERIPMITDRKKQLKRQLLERRAWARMLQIMI